MIPRYSRPEMTAIWEPKNRFRIWLNIELCALEKQSDIGSVPKSCLKAVQAAAKNHMSSIINPKAIERIE